MTETEFAQTLPAIAGRSRLDAGLKRLTPDEVRAFWEAVRRCYAAREETEGGARALAG